MGKMKKIQVRKNAIGKEKLDTLKALGEKLYLELTSTFDDKRQFTLLNKLLDTNEAILIRKNEENKEEIQFGVGETQEWL